MEKLILLVNSLTVLLIVLLLIALLVGPQTAMEVLRQFAVAAVK